MAPRARTLPPAPPIFAPFPPWAGTRATADAPEDAAYLAGAALGALHPIAHHLHPIGRLWRQRLALAAAAAVVRHNGRVEEQAALRDAWYLRRGGDDPGPAGRTLEAWRALADKRARSIERWHGVLPQLLQIEADERYEKLIGTAMTLARAGEGSALAAAAAVAAQSMHARPDSEALALWLADAVLACRLDWPAPVPLIASHLRRGTLRAAPSPDDPDRHSETAIAWRTAWALAYTHAAAGAALLHADLARRAERLIEVAPRLRGIEADRTVATLLGEDAQPATAGSRSSGRSRRRLFDRLVELGAVRELTGRLIFRLYGL